MESLQLSQVLADLSNLKAADRESASAVVNSNKPLVVVDPPTSAPAAEQQNSQRPTSSMKRAFSSEPPSQHPKFDKFGRRILLSNSGSRSGSAVNSTPGTPRRGDSDFEDDLERASTLMALYDIRAKLKQQDNSSLIKAREKINALAAKQQQQAAQAEREKAADQARKNRYSFPKT